MVGIGAGFCRSCRNACSIAVRQHAAVQQRLSDRSDTLTVNSTVLNAAPGGLMFGSLKVFFDGVAVSADFGTPASDTTDAGREYEL